MTNSEFEKLKTGQVIQNKYNNQWAFIVSQNFGDRVIAVRTIEVNDPSEWDIVEIKEEPNITKTATELHKMLKGFDWYNTIGITPDKIIVYVKKKKFAKPYEKYKDYAVEYRYIKE